MTSIRITYSTRNRLRIFLAAFWNVNLATGSSVIWQKIEINVWLFPHNMSLFAFIFTFICQMWENKINLDYDLYSIMWMLIRWLLQTVNLHSKSSTFWVTSFFFFFPTWGKFLSLVSILPMNQQIQLFSLTFYQVRNLSEIVLFIDVMFKWAYGKSSTLPSLFLNCNTFEVIFPEVSLKSLRRTSWSR